MTGRPWVHCQIDNQTTYDLALIATDVGGSGALGGHGRWNTTPPEKIPAKTAMNNWYDATTDYHLWADVWTSVTYQANVEGQAVHIVLTASANDHPGGLSGQDAKVSARDTINVYHNDPPLGTERWVVFTIKEWPE